MFKIDPDTLYTRDDLAAEFQALGINTDRLLARIAPRRVVRHVILGKHLIEALASAPDAYGRDSEPPEPTPETVLEATRPVKTRAGKRKIGGFCPSEIGLDTTERRATK